MKIVVIGTGFLGNSLIKKLKSLKYNVKVYHHDDKINIKKADYIFYLASYGNHYHQKEQDKIYKANLFDYIKLLRETVNIPYKALFYFSTSSVVLPIQTDYSDSKFMGEIMSKKFFKKYKKPITCIRPFSIYGEDEADFRFIPTAISNVKQGKDMPITEGWHDWIYIDDFIDALVLLIENSHKFIGKSFPIGTGKRTSNHEVANLVMKILDKKVKLVESDKVKRPYDTKYWVADITQLKSLGWKPKYSIEKGLKRVIEKL